MMETFQALPEPVQSSLVALPLYYGAGYLTDSAPTLMSAALMSLLPGLGAAIAPMLSADPMMQVAAAGAVSAASGYALGLGGGPLVDGGVSAASLYIARTAS
jgi:hypothetical protein